jgi:cell wall assembly regulator SMI1
MNWRELVTGIYESRARQPGIAGKPQFYPPASAEDIADAEARLNAKFPASIRSLLLETNGVMDMMAIDGGEWFDSMWLLWTVTELVEQNLFYRAATADGTYERDFSQLVFFAGAGTDGILFAFPLMEDRVCAPRVVVWHPIMDELDELAPSLEDFLTAWLTSTISV